MCPSFYGGLGAHNIGSYVKYGQERGISVGVFCLPWDFFDLCAGAVVGGRRAPRVPLWALVSARLAPAPRVEKVTSFCVCVPSLCVGGGAGAGAPRAWALSPAHGSAAQSPRRPRPRPSGLLVVAGLLVVVIPPPPGFPPPVAPL